MAARPWVCGGMCLISPVCLMCRTGQVSCSPSARLSILSLLFSSPFVGAGQLALCLAVLLIGHDAPAHLGDGPGSWALRWCVRGGDWMPLLVSSGSASSLELLLPGPWCVGSYGTCPLGGACRLPPPGAEAGRCWPLLGALAGALAFCPAPIGSAAAFVCLAPYWRGAS